MSEYNFNLTSDKLTLHSDDRGNVPRYYLEGAIYVSNDGKTRVSNIQIPLTKQQYDYLLDSRLKKQESNPLARIVAKGQLEISIESPSVN